MSKIVLKVWDTRILSDESDEYNKNGESKTLIEIIFDKGEDAEEFRTNLVDDWGRANDEFAYFEDDSGVTILTPRLENEEGFYAITIEEIEESSLNHDNVFLPYYTIHGTEIVINNVLQIAHLTDLYSLPEKTTVEFKRNEYDGISAIVVHEGRWVCSLPVRLPVFEILTSAPITSSQYVTLTRLYEDIQYLLTEKEER